MYKVDKEIEEAIRSVIRLGGNWHAGKRNVISNGDVVTVSYFDDGKRNCTTPRDNEVFGYDKLNGNFWISNCGWYTRTTKNLINSCFRAASLPYQVFVSKRRFCIRDTETQLERVIGDGVILKDEICANESSQWKKHV